MINSPRVCIQVQSVYIEAAIWGERLCSCWGVIG